MKGPQSFPKPSNDHTFDHVDHLSTEVHIEAGAPGRSASKLLRLLCNRHKCTTQELDEWPRRLPVLTLEVNSLHYILSDTGSAPDSPYDRGSAYSAHHTEDSESVNIQGMVRFRTSADGDWWHGIEFFMGDDCFVGYKELWNGGPRWQEMICRLRGTSKCAATSRDHDKIAFRRTAVRQLVWYRMIDRDLGFSGEAATGNGALLDRAEGRDRTEMEDRDGVDTSKSYARKVSSHAE